MVVALQVAGPAPRRWFRRRKASAQMEKIRVGDGMYYLITARPDKRGRLPWEEIRRLAGREFIIGATAKTVEQARSAQQSGADYLGVGAVFPSPTKKDAVRITAQQLREICGAVSIPAVAIGGITEENLDQLRGSGIAGIAVVSAIFASQSPGSAAARLAKMARELVGR